MPMVDYAEWHRREMARKRATGVPGAVGSGSAPGVYQPEYQRKRFGEIDREIGQNLMEMGKGAAQGASIGSAIPGVGTAIGAVVGATIGAAPGYARSARQSWDAAKEGDVQGVSRAMAPVSTAAYLNARFRPKLGLPGWTDPLYLPTKIVSELFGGPRTKIEEKRWDKLKRYGFNVPKWVDDKSKKFDVVRQDLPPDFVGYDKEGNWVNNKFAKTRSEKDLTGGDLGQSAAMYETFGGMWDAASQDTKKAIGDLALGNNMVKEFRGTIDIGWDENTLAKAQEILNRDPGVQEAIKNAPKQYVLPEYTLPWERK